ncbi:MAG TPA: hypothetical protein VFZ66_29030 [Herpetosiphonaceae bacterium]
MQQKLRLIIAGIYLGVLLTGCEGLPSRGERIGSATPEEAVRHSILEGADLPPHIVQSFKILGARTWAHGSIILHTMRDQRHPEEEMFSYHFVERGELGWHATYGKGFNQAMFQEEQFIAFRTDGVEVAGGQYLVMFGQIHQPGVEVEVSLGNQQIGQDAATGNAFLLLMPLSASAHQLRVLDRQGNILERINLSPHLSGG